MAKIFKVSGTVQRGPAAAEWPWPVCAKIFELDDACRTEDSPKFGEHNTRPWPSDIVIRVEADEAQAHGIKPGDFFSPLPIAEALRRLANSG